MLAIETAMSAEDSWSSGLVSLPALLVADKVADRSAVCPAVLLLDNIINSTMARSTRLLPTTI